MDSLARADRELLEATAGRTVAQIAERLARPRREVLDRLNHHRARGAVIRCVDRDTSVARWGLR